MNISELKEIEQIEEFLTGVRPVVFSVLGGKAGRYKWVQGELERFRYAHLPRSHKGVMIAYLCKVSGYSRQQVTRLIGQYTRTGRLEFRQRTVNGFSKKYTREDVVLLAAMDELHDAPSGPAVKKLCERAWKKFGDLKYENLSGISVSHLYNLRKSSTYDRRRKRFEKTRPRRSSIGERRKPQPDGQPGYIRIDTVHQGDMGKTKGVYHINAIDEVTQYEIICTVPRISDEFLLPALTTLLDDFPFKVLGFHSDNGSEYINEKVAALLQKLLIDFTKSRPRRSNDNALAEGKNGAVVRKVFGRSHIQQCHAEMVNIFNRTFLNPYLNYHRPCFFAKTLVDDAGKERKVYRFENMMTPYDKLKSLPNADSYLKTGVSMEDLDAIAMKISDNEAAGRLQEARQELFDTIDGRTKTTA